MKTWAWCGCVPGPQEPMAYLPGSLRMTSINSLKFLAGTDGCTVSTVRERATSETMRRSVRGS